MRLVHVSGTEVKVGDKVTDLHGEVWEVTGFYPKPAPSTGRIQVRSLDPSDSMPNREFYPSVFDCKIVD